MKPSGVDLTSGCEKQPTGLDFLYSIFQLYLAKHDPGQKVLNITTSQGNLSLWTSSLMDGTSEHVWVLSILRLCDYVHSFAQADRKA